MPRLIGRAFVHGMLFRPGSSAIGCNIGRSMASHWISPVRQQQRFICRSGEHESVVASERIDKYGQLSAGRGWLEPVASESQTAASLAGEGAACICSAVKRGTTQNIAIGRDIT